MQIPIDGQLCFDLEFDDWEKVAHDGVFQGEQVFRPEKLLTRLSRIEGKDDLKIVLCQPSPKKQWSALLLVRVSDRWVRARSVITKCPGCAAKLDGADVSDQLLFLGASDPEFAWKQARALEVLACPNCGTKLDPGLRLIWVHPRT